MLSRSEEEQLRVPRRDAAVEGFVVQSAEFLPRRVHLEDVERAGVPPHVHDEQPRLVQTRVEAALRSCGRSGTNNCWQWVFSEKKTAGWLDSRVPPAWETPSCVSFSTHHHMGF